MCLVDELRGNLSVVNSRRLKAEVVGAPIVANGRTVEPTADEPVAACSTCPRSVGNEGWLVA
jgi:hypothetical protein